ncbi:ATP phosphoribosyltransferase regulatory subunit [Chakrabartyella piscis]|uniref:ATP phosphoribosyltransferase regulatory subunit n=1 Tax=Chakrabartyella piscis TaxID=2918914 RepID=UPI0029583FB7|nr:ATP phosphoribosyltransferase regulatory subunit [Chakrabartyella piscis]
MTISKMLFKKEEEVIFSLRAIFEQYGYKKFKMSKFEEYDFYAANRSFLGSEHILTFNGMDGKLLALKPDVTLSIVKHAKGSTAPVQKVYYNENVYRGKKGAGEYKEIMQVGLEYIGEVDAYATLEVLQLAQKSLEAISESYIMDISHMGFVTGLLEDLELDYQDKEQVLRMVADKNTHEITRICEQKGVCAEEIKRIVDATALYGDLKSVLPKAKALCKNKRMEDAMDELDAIGSFLKSSGAEQSVNLDFSVVNDMDYYNGIVFQGFVKGVPSSILLGGRYDNLVHKLGKDTDAIGFALYLDLLENLDTQKEEYDVDILLLYDETTDLTALMNGVQMLTSNGQSVRVQKEDTGELKYKQLLCIKDRGLEIIG